MRRYEYKVVPVPAKCMSSKGLAPEYDPASQTVEAVLNDLGLQGWEYVRTDRMTLQRPGILGRGEVTREMMVFCRPPVAQAYRAPMSEAAPADPVALLPDRATAEKIEEIRARKVKNPELLQRAKSGQCRVVPRRASAGNAAPETDAIAAE